jgi:hypothetical protein
MPCFSEGEGVGDREETWVMVGETAADGASQHTISMSEKQCSMGERCDFIPWFARTRRGVGRPGKGKGSLHLYHRSIWLWPGCDLELSSFEMPGKANKSDRFWRSRAALLRCCPVAIGDEAAEAVARLGR